MKKAKGISKTFIGPMVLIVTILIIGSFFVSSQINSAQAARTRKTQDAYIKNQVEMAVSMLEQINNKRLQGTYTMDQAQKLGADMLRELRYGADKKGYFWADTSKGENVVLYGDKNVEGKNRYNAQSNGIFYIQEIIKKGLQPGGGYTNYYFKKLDGTTLLAKRSYSLYFQPFDWVVGTGYYLEDLK